MSLLVFLQGTAGPDPTTVYVDMRALRHDRWSVLITSLVLFWFCFCFFKCMLENWMKKNNLVILSFLLAFSSGSAWWREGRHTACHWWSLGRYGIMLTCTRNTTNNCDVRLQKGCSFLNLSCFFDKWLSAVADPPRCEGDHCQHRD